MRRAFGESQAPSRSRTSPTDRRCQDLRAGCPLAFLQEIGPGLRNQLLLIDQIDLEIRRKLSRGRLNDDLCRREGERLDATHRAFRSRAVEVADRYRVGLHLAPAGIWLCRLPAYHITVRLMRRNSSANAVFSWNPIDGRIEPRACDGCLAPTDSAWLCDDSVHYVCDDCLAACPECGRRFCRACTRACPRSHVRSQLSSSPRPAECFTRPRLRSSFGRDRHAVGIVVGVAAAPASPLGR